MKFFLTALTVVLVGSLSWLVFWVPIFGFNYETSRGEHTGYITAVQRQGIFFKTGRVYVKTETESSQEDIYCVVDKDVENQLKEFASNKMRVKVSYYGLISAGITRCEGEGEIVYKVEAQ